MSPAWDIYCLPDTSLFDRRARFTNNEGCPERAAAILRRLPEDASCYAEVGVYLGDLAELVIRRRPGMKMLLVDSWSEADVTTEDAHTTTSQAEQSSIMNFCMDRLEFARDYITIIPLPSAQAAPNIPDHSLDMVFIDADHSYEAIREDIESWWPKVKPGGWIGGHDYDNPSFPFFGVKRAVDEHFGPRAELDINFTWFVKKEKE